MRKTVALKPILGCEVYVAQGSRFDKSGPQTETNHLVLLAETDEGYKNLIKLVSSGYTEGFYYRPRIDKELLAQHSRRTDRPEQLPQRAKWRAPSESSRRVPRSKRRRGFATFSARITSSSRCSIRGSRSRRSSTRASFRSPAS